MTLQQQPSLYQMYLTLSIRCLLPQHPQKNCLLKIHNPQLDLHLQLQNNFTHRYQYVYRLWPCQLDNSNLVKLELFEKGQGQDMKLRGTAQARISYTTQGETYKFHGNRSEGQVFMMKFWVQKDEQEKDFSPEEAELRKMNNDMQQNLLRYRKEIQNYQEFLYFTNNVIKELNKDSPEPNRPQPNQTIRTNSPPLINTQAIDRTPEQPKTPLITTTKYWSPPAHQSEDEQHELIDYAAQTYEPSKSQIQSQIGSQNSDRKPINGNDNSLSKYRYLQEIKRSRVENSNVKNGGMSQVSQKTPKMAPKHEVDEMSPEIQNKKMRQMQITNRIKQRRLQYFNLEQLKQADQSKQQKMSNRQTPIHRLSTNQITKILKQPIENRYLIEESHIQKVQRAQMVIGNNQKNSTRSQTGLKEMISLKDKSLSSRNYVVEVKEKTNMQNSSDTPSNYERSKVKSIQRITPSHIVKTVTAPIQKPNQQGQVIQEQEDQVVRNVARRRKIISKNSASIIGEIEQMRHSIHSSKKSDSLTGSVVSKLIIFNIKTTFYANFRSNTKKCIIEHNGQVYQTKQQNNNLKQTFWDDRVIISNLKPSQDLIFMVYAIRMDQLELQGTAIINTQQLLSTPQRHRKFYLYFENIAVGGLEIDLDQEKIAYRRLTVSLPQIQQRSPPRQQLGPNTFRLKTVSQQLSKISVHPSQRRQAYKTAQYRQYSSNSELEGSSILPSNNELTKKVRNVKLNKYSRLGKVK